MPEPHDPTGERIGAAIRAAAQSVDAPRELRERIAADRARQGSSRRRRFRPAALVAVDVVGLSYAEAGAALGVGESTITTRLHRARARVASDLARPSTVTHA